MENILTQEEVWNKIADEWSTFKTKIFPDFDKFFENCSGKFIDVGCGSGRNFIKKEGTELYGVDFSEEMLRLAEQTAKKKNILVELKKVNLGKEKIPYPNNFFDNACFVAALHCLEFENHREESLRELYRILKKGGMAFVTVWSRSHPKIKDPNNNWISWGKPSQNYKRFYYFYTFEEFKLNLEKAGFKIEKLWEDENICAIVSK